MVMYQPTICLLEVGNLEEEALGKENYVGKETPYFYTFLRKTKHMFHKLGLHWDVSFFCFAFFGQHFQS